MSSGQNVIPLEENSLQVILNDDFAECFLQGLGLRVRLGLWDRIYNHVYVLPAQ